MGENAKHTPGPWQQHDGDFVCVDGDASKMICDIRGWGWLSKSGEENAISVQTANARLIAAAPDMLDVLQTIENDDNQIPTWLMNRIHEVIKKATT